MPQSGPTPISFTPKMYIVAGVVAGLVAVVSAVAAASIKHGGGFGYVVAVFWVVISVLAFRAARRPAA